MCQTRLTSTELFIYYESTKGKLKTKYTVIFFVLEVYYESIKREPKIRLSLVPWARRGRKLLLEAVFIMNQ